MRRAVRRSLRALVAGAFALAPGDTPLAAPLAGVHEIQLGGALAVWVDPFPDMPACQVEEDTEVCFDAVESLDPRGRLMGTGNVTISSPDVSGSLDMTMRGTVQGRNGAARATMALRFAGVLGVVGGRQLPVNGSGTSVIEIPVSAVSALGETQLRVCVPRAGCQRAVIPSEEPLDSDGGWTLALDVSAFDGRKLTGTALATFEDDRTLHFAVTGKYDARRDESSLKLAGQGVGKGTSIELRRLRVEGGAIESGEIRFKLFGQQGQGLLSP